MKGVTVKLARKAVGRTTSGTLVVWDESAHMEVHRRADRGDRHALAAVAAWRAGRRPTDRATGPDRRLFVVVVVGANGVRCETFGRDGTRGGRALGTTLRAARRLADKVLATADLLDDDTVHVVEDDDPAPELRLHRGACAPGTCFCRGRS